MIKKWRFDKLRSFFAAEDSSFCPAAVLSSTIFKLQDINPDGSGGLRINSNPGLLLRNVLTLTITVAALLTLYHLIMGAIHWILSGGDKGKVEDARNQIFAAVIGILILACTWAIFQLVLTIAFGTDAGGISLPTLVDGI